jgi:hypothetical protein
VKNYSGDPSERAVTWSISPQTANFVDGTLTPQVGEEGTVYTITASSAALPNSLSASSTVIVTPAVDAAGTVDGVTIPGSKLGDTVDWLTIAGKKVGGQPYYLIVRKNGYGTVTGPNYYSGSALQTAMTNFYGTISTTAGIFVVNSDADTVIGTFGSPTGPISTPMQGSTKAFALSFPEAASYLSMSVRGTPSPATAQSNWGKLNDETNRRTWLRTRYQPNYSATLETSGNINNYNNANNGLARPAMWVKADIFAPDTTTP